MRIIGGSLKGKKLFQPIDQDTRPLKDLVKESIFNIIQHSLIIKLIYSIQMFSIYFQELDLLVLNVFQGGKKSDLF